VIRLTIVYQCAELNDDAGNGKNEGTKSESAVQSAKHGDKVHGGGGGAFGRAHFLDLRPRAHEEHSASDGHHVAEGESDGELSRNDKKHRDGQKIEKETHGEAGCESYQPVCAR